MSRPSAVMVCVLVMGALPPACVDTSALDYVPSTTDAGSGATPACVECLTGQSGPCSSDYQRCVQRQLCKAVLECLIEKACMTVPAGDRVACGLPCADEHGLLSATDPSIELLSQINICALNNCSELCGVP